MIYKTKGTCSREIHLEIEGNIITALQFIGGCDGNLKGLAAMAKGRTPDEVIPLLTGIRCGARETSCPDQLAAALKSVMKNSD